ncbi:hypothetical protein N7481_007191 [Penicillium waksmanii]|uniref:uncharacterized protein n=1 Tax=Penicillium waksmanii TaxID=69791 RepID=UPI002546F1D4|nr:uncharacterized protein N7481_007191 [Penicillium waksmanii]KAJ5979893.1 hypothetical protein N7481_007191 [Penicillium waksmanii]
MSVLTFSSWLAGLPFFFLVVRSIGTGPSHEFSVGGLCASGLFSADGVNEEHRRSARLATARDDDASRDVPDFRSLAPFHADHAGLRWEMPESDTEVTCGSFGVKGAPGGLVGRVGAERLGRCFTVVAC